MKRKHVFHDASRRAKLRTAPNPLSLADGEWQSFTDVRLADGAIKARFGTSLLGAIVSAATFRGAWVGRFERAETIFVATYIALSNKVRVYTSTDAVTWTEITRQFNGGPQDTGIGPYSLTRLDDDGMVWFAMMQDPDVKVISYPQSSFSQDCIVFGNQSSYPRVYGRFYGGGTLAATNSNGSLQCAICEPITAPSAARGAGIKAVMAYNKFGFAIRDAANTTYVNSGANFVLADAGSSATDNYPVLTVGTSSAAGDTAIIDMATGAQLLSGKQLHIGVHTSWVNFLQSVKIEVGNYSGSFTSAATIWDPGTTGPQPVVNTLAADKYLYSFDVEQYNTGTTYDAIRLTFAGPAVSASKTVNFFYICPGVAPTYANPGQTGVALTWINGGSHTESQPIFIGADKISYPLTLNTPGGNEVPDSYSALAPPSSASIMYQYFLPLVNPTQAMIDKGVEGMRIYRKRPQDGDYFLVEHYELAIYSETAGPPVSGPTWSFISGSDSSIVRDSLLSREPLSYTTPPADLHIPMPKTRCLAFANGRAYAGQRVTGSYNILVSQYNQPFRFIDDVNIDPDTNDVYPLGPTALNVQGDQINAIVAVSSAQVGIASSESIGDSTVYFLGEKDCYATGGKTTAQIRRISTLGFPGTISPGTVAIGKDSFFYLDRNMMPRRVRGGQSQEIGLQRIENLTKGIPADYRRYAWGCYHDQKYYLSYVPSGATTPTKVLVWDDYIEDWVSVDDPPLAFEGCVSWQDTSVEKVRLVAFMQQVGASTTLVAYDYDGSATTDLGDNITISMTSLALHSADWSVVSLGRVGLVMDGVTGATATIGVSYWGGGTRSTSLSLNSTGSELRICDDPSGATISGDQKGGSATLSLSMSVPGGTRIISINAELEEYATEFQMV